MPGTMLLGQGMLGVSAAAEGAQKETAVAFRMRGDMQFKVERQTTSFSYKWMQAEEEDGANMKKEENAEVHIVTWISMEHREEVHEKIQRKMRCLLWDRAETEEGGNGGAVQPGG